MARIISFPLHHLHGVDDCCGRESCFICEGGLALCLVCGGAEGALTTDCPGVMVPTILSDAVYEGKLDYDRLLGWVERSTELGAFINQDRAARRGRR